MLFSSFLAITLTPVLMLLFIRGKIRPEEKNPISKILHWIYEPIASLALRFKKTVIILAIIVLVTSLYPFIKLGSEFMPSLYEGTLFYMPVTAPAPSISVGLKITPASGQDLDKVSGGGPGFWKSGPCGNGH